MKSLRLGWILWPAALGVPGALLLTGVVSSGGEPREDGAAAPQRGQGPPAVATATLPRGLVTLRVDFRSKGKQGAKAPTTWDGELSVSRGRIHELRLWQDDPRESIQGNRWTLTTRRSIPWNSQQRKRGHETMPLRDAALVVELIDVTPETELRFTTRQGDFDLRVRDIPFGGARGFLNGLAQISRIANSTTMLSAPTEDAFPSAAQGPDGRIYVAYVAFAHGNDFRVRRPLPEAPKDLGYLERPAGGDQVLLVVLDGDRWQGPLAVTPPGQDVHGTALAVDGSGRPWVFWSASRDGDWDLYARSMKEGRFSESLRLTTGSGPDILPAAAADRSGRVWVTWQAFRGNNSDVVALRQDGDRFGRPIPVAGGSANEWAPAIAPSQDGRVAIAWDTYGKGDYDVRCRVWGEGRFGEPIPVAASRRAEMRPSVTYDAAGRLWVAYESSPEKWGKDWGALEKEGAPLYRGRAVAVRVWSEGRLWQPADDPMHAFYPWYRTRKARRGNVRLALPRLTTDAAGRVWLAVRSQRLGARVGVGSTWFEHAAWYEGDRWSREVVCAGTDNILDSRPALLPRPSGEVVLIAASDGRFATAGRLPQWFLRELRRKGQKIQQQPLASPWPDAVNNELVMAEFGPAPGVPPARVRLEPAPPEKAARDDGARKEAEDVARARAARVTVGGRTLRLWRGEFHRHTELSQDGGGDGLLMDMWRYGLDAAGLDWIGNGDHDNGSGREYSWWITQKTADMFHVAGVFTPVFSYERSCSYPDGHRNVVFARRGIRTLPRLRGGMGKSMDEQGPETPRPPSPDSQLLYRYLTHFDGVCASHTSGTDMGTDWRDNNPSVEPIVEIYQGCRQSYEMPQAPRSNSRENSMGGWRPFGFVSLALKKGYRLGFQASSDHVSTHISYCNVWVEAPTRESILAAMKARRVYGSTDNIIADVRCGDHFMGEEFSLKDRPALQVHLTGTQPFAKVHVIKNGEYVYSAEPGKRDLRFEWTDLDAAPGRTSYYYVRGEQRDGELVWVSPMWIRYEP